MSLFLIALLVVGQSTNDQCPSMLALKGAGASRQAKAYADCMSRPSLPVAAELAGKEKQCAPARDASKEKAMAWVDAIAANFPACEIRLEIK